jgi:hypothetical protein
MILLFCVLMLQPLVLKRYILQHAIVNLQDICVTSYKLFKVFDRNIALYGSF